MEEYRVIKDFENYSVSNFGNVKSNVTNKIIKQGKQNSGYFFVILYKGPKLKENKTIHRLVAEAFIPNPKTTNCVDHINNNKLNNNVSNLRWVSSTENNMNRSLSSKNTSGVKGVNWHKREQKWEARICVNGKRTRLGYFEKLEDALNARLKASEKYFGEFMNKCEKEITLNIKLPKNTKLTINLNIDEDEEYKALENEFEELINS
jgi:hypothetical protein